MLAAACRRGKYVGRSAPYRGMGGEATARGGAMPLCWRGIAPDAVVDICTPADDGATIFRNHWSSYDGVAITGFRR